MFSGRQLNSLAYFPVRYNYNGNSACMGKMVDGKVRERGMWFEIMHMIIR